MPSTDSKKSAPIDPTTGEEFWGFRDYAETVYILPGDRIKGRFKKLTLGPVGEYGRPPIVTFEAIAGSYHIGPNDTGGIADVVPGQEYSLWLLTSVARSTFKEGAPKDGEVFTFTNHGRRDSKTRKDKDGNPVSYHEFEAAFPERPVTEEAVSWDTLDVPGE